MNTENITYEQFIAHIIQTRGQWHIPDTEYFEVHHIIPRCLGGQGEIRKGRKYQEHPNLIYLYAEEHFIAHKLLALENPTNKALVFAWSMMAFPKGKTQRGEITAEEYAILRKLQSDCLKADGGVLKNRSPWNKGLTKETDERLLAVSIKMKGVNTWCEGLTRSEDTRRLISQAQKARAPETFIKNTLNKKAITNGLETHFIDPELPLPEGFTFGTHLKGIANPNKKWSVERRLETAKKVSGINNNMYQNGHKVAGGRNGHAIYIYTFEGIDYDCRDALMEVLKPRFKDISESAIRRIQSGKYTSRISSKYQYVIDNLTWRRKNEN